MLEYNGPPPQPVARTRWTPGEDDLAEVQAIFKLKSPLIIPDVYADTPRAQNLGSALVLPLKVGARIIGVLNIESDEVRGFDDLDMAVLQPLANQLAIALENARLYEQSRALAALKRHVEALRARHGMSVETTFGAEPDLPLATKEVLYRVAQEALQNVIKHANASHVAVTLTTSEDGVLLEIGDDGQGFEPRGSFPGHLGLQSMRERVEGAGGAFWVESARGSGTRIRAVTPFPSRGAQVEAILAR